MTSPHAQPRTPSYSPFTPTPESTHNSPAHRAHIDPSNMDTTSSSKPTPPPTSATEDNNANMAIESSTGTPTATIDGAATPQAGESSQTAQTSDRAAEFEEETTRVRRDARESAEEFNIDGDQQQSSTPEAGKSDQRDDNVDEHASKQAAQESLGAGVVREQMAVELKPARETTLSRRQAVWVDNAVSRAARNKNNSGSQDMLIVLDPNDLSKTYLIDSRVIRNVSVGLADLCEQAAQASKDLQHNNELKYLLVIEHTEAMPKLKVVPLDHELETLIQPKPEPDVKLEEGTATGSDDRNIPAQDAQLVDTTSWVKAYHSFFHMLDGEQNHKIPKKNPDLALPQIERILNIAREYQAGHRLSTAFDVLFLGYVQKGTLWRAIETAPEQWLNVGIELRSRVIFDEAFKHLVGKSANREDGTQTLKIPTDMQTCISIRSNELYCKRMRVEKALLMVTLPRSESNPNPEDDPTSTGSPVSQHDRPTEYSTVNIFRDWLGAHIGALDYLAETSNEQNEISALKNICNHDNGCKTVAGHFDVIDSGGNAYLHADDVCSNWNTANFGKVNSSKEKRALEALKEKASELVAELVYSTLKLENDRDLFYLTCVEVDPEDVPWKTEPENESDEEMEDE